MGQKIKEKSLRGIILEQNIYMYDVIFKYISDFMYKHNFVLNLKFYTMHRIWLSSGCIMFKRLKCRQKYTWKISKLKKHVYKYC
jgi:hypothetical protein